MIYRGESSQNRVGSPEYVCKQHLDALTSLLTPVQTRHNIQMAVYARA